MTSQPTTPTINPTAPGTQARNADLQSLVETLTEQQARRLDLILPAHRITSRNGLVSLDGLDPHIEEDGITDPNGRYAPTPVFHEGVGASLDIPSGYLKRIATERPDLYDATINGFLHGNPDLGANPITKPQMLRLWKPTDNTSVGTARAFLSDRYSIMDNLDVLMSVLEGIRAAGVEVAIDGADLTDRRMVVRIKAPEVQALAPDLLKGYRSPFTGATGDENPTVFAGFQVSNSETGGGAFTITPRLVVQVCDNGLVLTKDATRAVHLGGKLDQGIIRWSAEAEEQNLRLVKVKARDSVATFLDADYMKHAIAQLTEKATQEVADVEVVQTITKRAGYSKAETDGILAHFIQGGQMTTGGIMHAATAYAQTVTDADAAYDIEQRAVALLA